MSLLVLLSLLSCAFAARRVRRLSSELASHRNASSVSDAVIAPLSAYLEKRCGSKEDFSWELKRANDFLRNTVVEGDNLAFRLAYGLGFENVVEGAKILAKEWPSVAQSPLVSHLVDPILREETRSAVKTLSLLLDDPPHTFLQWTDGESEEERLLELEGAVTVPEVTALKAYQTLNQLFHHDVAHQVTEFALDAIMRVTSMRAAWTQKLEESGATAVSITMGPEDFKKELKKYCDSENLGDAKPGQALVSKIADLASRVIPTDSIYRRCYLRTKHLFALESFSTQLLEQLHKGLVETQCFVSGSKEKKSLIDTFQARRLELGH